MAAELAEEHKRKKPQFDLELTFHLRDKCRKPADHRGESISFAQRPYDNCRHPWGEFFFSL
jgi:hypothetical protein